MEPYLERILSVLPKNAWCKPFKAQRMAELIVEHRPRVCVEIGVFNGDALFVMAQAIKHLGTGPYKVYGIDPWSKAAAIEGMADAGPNKAWWSSLDYEPIYRGCRVRMIGLQLDKVCELIRSRADDPTTLGRFDDASVGFLHFDGNHGPQAVTDAKLWLPKCAPGCILFHDDVSWVEDGKSSNADAFDFFLANGFTTLEPMIGDCAILKRER